METIKRFVLCFVGFLVVASTATAQSTQGFASNLLEDDSGNVVLQKQEAPPRKWAVLVGVNHYTNLTPLKFGRSDAERLYQVLTEQCGYEPRFITLITDGENETSRRPLKHNITNQMGRVLAEVRPQDHVLVFFTGHGFISESGEGFLATQDTDVNDLKRTALSAMRVMKRLESLQASQKILILDCCLERSGSDEGSSQVDAASLPLQFSNARGVVTFASCSPGQRSWELAGGNNGVFTHFLAKGMEGASDQSGNQNGKVELTELVRYTTNEVAKETAGYGSKQVPMALFGPMTDSSNDVVATQTKPYLIQASVGDKWNRKIKLTRRFGLTKGKRKSNFQFTRELEADHSIRFTVPSSWGRPQGSIATYKKDQKSISGRRHWLLGIKFPASRATGELKSRVLRHSVDTFGSEAKFDKSDGDYIDGLNGGAQVPAIAAIHPIQIDEAILPQPGSDQLDSDRILELMRRMSPDCDPVFEQPPVIASVAEETYLGGPATRFYGNAVVNARIGLAEGHNVRMRFVCQFQVLYSRKYLAVVAFKCNAEGTPFDNLNNEETLQHEIEIELQNKLEKRYAGAYAAKK